MRPRDFCKLVGPEKNGAQPTEAEFANAEAALTAEIAKQGLVVYDNRRHKDVFASVTLWFVTARAVRPQP